MRSSPSCPTVTGISWGDGSPTREFLYVDDAADGIIAAALRSEETVLNLGTGEAYKIGDIARWCGEAAGFKGKIEFNTDRFVGVSKRVLDVTRVNKVLGWKAETPIRDGISRAVDWYRASLR